jgi:hypothetical protein
MTLRTYLRFLRPVRSLLVIAFYTWGVFLEEHTFSHFDAATSQFLALATALPLLLGVAIAGASHEPMHRAFFPLLPDGPRHLRRATLLAIAVFAFAVTCAVAYVEPSVPPFATLGLAAGLMALPCINRYQFLRGLGGLAGAFGGWFLFILTTGGRLRPAMIAAPWVFLLGGFALTLASLAGGFSRRHLRQRAERPMISLQSMFFSSLFHPYLMARQGETGALYRSRRAKGIFPMGRDWTLRSVGSSTRAWMQVFWHAYAGRRRHSNFLASHVAPVASMLVGLLVAIFAAIFFMGPSYTLSDYGRLLATLAAPENMLPSSDMAVAFWFMGGVIQATVAAFSLFMILTPQLAYPISRERLARVVFGLSLVQLAVALALPAAAFFLLSLVGQIASNHFWPGYGLPTIVALDLALAVGLPLLACAGSFGRPVVRILWALLFATGLLVAVITRGDWTPYVLTLPGIVATVLVASANVGLLWLRLRRHYRTCDLLFHPGLFNNRLNT